MELNDVIRYIDEVLRELRIDDFITGLSDIANVLEISRDEIDFGYIEQWVAKLDLRHEWNLVRERLGL